MIIIIWVLSALVSIAPLLGWKDPEWSARLDMNECLVSQDVGYQIFATTSSFYGPLVAILFLYWRIFLVARKRIRRRQQVTNEKYYSSENKPKLICEISSALTWTFFYIFLTRLKISFTSLLLFGVAWSFLISNTLALQISIF